MARHHETICLPRHQSGYQVRRLAAIGHVDEDEPFLPIRAPVGPRLVFSPGNPTNPVIGRLLHCGPREDSVPWVHSVGGGHAARSGPDLTCLRIPPVANSGQQGD